MWTQQRKTNKELTPHYPNNTGASIANKWDPNARQHVRERRHIAANKRVKVHTDYGLLPPEPINNQMLHRPISPTVIEQLHESTTTSKRKNSPDISRLVAAALEHETAIPDEIPVKAPVEKLLDGVCDSVRALLTGDVVRSWRAIENGTTPSTQRYRQKYWQHWCQYVRHWRRSSFLDDATQLESNIII